MLCFLLYFHIKLLCHNKNLSIDLTYIVSLLLPLYDILWVSTENQYGRKCLQPYKNDKINERVIFLFCINVRDCLKRVTAGNHCKSCIGAFMYRHNKLIIGSCREKESTETNQIHCRESHTIEYKVKTQPLPSIYLPYTYTIINWENFKKKNATISSRKSEVLVKNFGVSDRSVARYLLILIIKQKKIIF